jgi:DUF1009 family protein
MTTLGIIAGGGDLPRAVAESARKGGRDVFVVSLTGDANDWTAQFPREQVSLGEMGKALRSLSAHKCQDVIFAGRVDRPRFTDLRLDTKGALVAPRIAAAALRGDDALLRAVVDVFEKEGHRVLGIAEAAPSLVVREGSVGRNRPSAEALQDIKKGFQVVARMGELDIGQAAAVCDGLVLAVEAAEGTDAMIARIGTLRETLRGTAAQRRGVLVKALKPTQDAKTDMPVVGVETVRKARAVHLAGIALEAGASLIVDKAAVAAEADRLGLFVVGVKP